ESQQWPRAFGGENAVVQSNFRVPVAFGHRHPGACRNGPFEAQRRAGRHARADGRRCRRRWPWHRLCSQPERHRDQRPRRRGLSPAQSARHRGCVVGHSGAGREAARRHGQGFRPRWKRSGGGGYRRGHDSPCYAL
ncbi:hypothetical protein OY671_011851, partial [Metschnikowia pulcherrima]